MVNLLVRDIVIPDKEVAELSLKNRKSHEWYCLVSISFLVVKLPVIFCFQCENSKFFTLLARSSNYVDEPLVSILYAHGDFSWVHLHQNISYICCGLLLPVDNATTENM